MFANSFYAEINLVKSPLKGLGMGNLHFSKMRPALTHSINEHDWFFIASLLKQRSEPIWTCLHIFINYIFWIIVFLASFWSCFGQPNWVILLG